MGARRVELHYAMAVLLAALGILGLAGGAMPGLIFSVALVALALLCVAKGSNRGVHHLWHWLLIPMGMSVSCRTAPAAGPVPVQGTTEEVSALSGEWTGRYWSKATGRHGTIRFDLPEQADTGFGEVEITFSPSLHLLLEDTEENKLEPKPCTVIDVRVVRVEAGRVRGTMVPYWDPDCDCRARTVFEGTLSGSRITGTFATQRASKDRRVLKGEWQVARKGDKS